jgi:hypothetical protein
METAFISSPYRLRWGYVEVLNRKHQSCGSPVGEYLFLVFSVVASRHAIFRAAAGIGENRRDYDTGVVAQQVKPVIEATRISVRAGR